MNTSHKKRANRYDHLQGIFRLVYSVFRWIAPCGIVLALTAPLRAADGCSEVELQRASAVVKDVRAQLLADKVEEMDTNVPPTVQLQLEKMKDSLAKFLDLYMMCQPANGADVQRREIELATQLNANKTQPPLSFPEDAEEVQQVYGADLKLIVRRPEGAPELIAVRASFGIMCSEDTMLLIYEWHSGKWRQILRWQSGRYSRVSGAFGDFFKYVVISSPTSSVPFVAVAHGHPWCTSGYSGFGLDVIKLAQNTTPQKVLLHREGDYNRTADRAAEMLKTPSGFQLRVQNLSVDFVNLFLEPVVYSYLFAGDDVRRVQPVAVNARDFVDVWLQSDWAEASEWSARENANSLKEEHARIEELRNAATGETLRFGSVRSCGKDPTRVQVELDEDSGASAYYQVREEQDSFTMLSASAHPNPDCTHSEIVPKH